MALLQSNPKAVSETNTKDSLNIQVLYPHLEHKTREEVVFRKNGKSIDKLIEFDAHTGARIKTTHYDYFNDKKIRSIDEYDRETGNKVRTINYVLYKSIDEYDIKTGKKIRTINFNIKDENKISSIQEYDIETGKIVTLLIYKRDGKTVGIIKNIDPKTDKITNWVNKDDKINSINNFSTRNYENIKPMDVSSKEDIAKLIDNLYSNNMNFENI